MRLLGRSVSLTPGRCRSRRLSWTAFAGRWRPSPWTADDITIQSVMTHAESASNRDGGWMHELDA